MNAATMPAANLDGARVLLVEDNFLVGRLLRTMLERMGCIVHGPVASLEEGLPLAERGAFDAAVLDIKILGGTSVPLAEHLRRRDCPVIFVTGYGSPRALPEAMRAVPRLFKPVDESLLQNALRDNVRRSS